MNTIEDDVGKGLEEKVEKLESKYKICQDGVILIDFSKILEEFSLKNYDVNLKTGNGNGDVYFKKIFDTSELKF